MLKLWLREICRAPGDGAGGGAGSGDTGDVAESSAAGVAAAAADAAAAAAGIDGAMGGGPSGFDSSGIGGDANLNGDLDMAQGWDLDNTGQTGRGLGFDDADRGGDIGRGVSHALDRAWDSFTNNIGATVAGVVGTAFGGPLAGAALSALASNAIDGKSPAEAIGQGIGGLAGLSAPGLAGIAASVAGSRGGAALGAQVDSSLTGANTSTAGLSIDPTASALDFSGPPSGGTAGGGVDFTYSPPVTGQTFNSYIPTPAQAPVQPAWRGLLSPPPQPNYWQGNSLFTPTRGLLS